MDSSHEKRDVLAQKLIYRECMATLWRVRKQPKGFIQLAQEFQRVGRIRSLFNDFWHGRNNQEKVFALVIVTIKNRAIFTKYRLLSPGSGYRKSRTESGLQVPLCLCASSVSLW